ncbi:MAG TPA: GAF domain-containing protein [Gaiellaceae bacterium]|nr:GAF domain-containing protein [Gaiellaceae bacterium]
MSVEEERGIEQRGALLHAARLVAGERGLDEVLDELLGEAMRLLRADAADCYLLDPARRVLRCAAARGFADPLVGFVYPADRGVAALALERGGPVAVETYGEAVHELPHAAYRDFDRVLAAPVSWGGEVRGVLGAGLRREGGRTFEPGALDLLEALAGLASLALAGEERSDERARQARIGAALGRIAALLSEPLSAAQTLDAAARAAADALGGEFAAVLLPEAGRLVVAGAHRVPRGLRRREPPAVLVEAAADGRSVAARRVREDARFADGWRRAGFEALLAVPVDGGGRGLLAVFFADEREFGRDDLEVAGLVARAARAAILRDRAFESERIARALSQQLARSGNALEPELDPVAVLAQVAEQARALLGADAASVALLEGDELVLGAASGPDLEGVVGTRAPSTGWLGGDAVQLRAPVSSADVSADVLHGGADAVLERGHRAYAAAPLGGREGVVRGVLAVYAAEPRAWREEEIEALAALAGNASVALANAELYRRLALEHAQSSAILANVADGIVAVDRDGRVVVWNAAAERITGVPASEALGRTPFEVLRRELESGQGGTNRLVPIMRGEEEVWLSLSEAVMREPSGEVAGRIFAFRDISAERVLERMKSDFVSTVSHELRTPLTSIYGFAETLLRSDIGFSDDERQTFLGYIASESERLTRIVDALLDVARLDAGTLEVQPVPIDLRTFLSEAVDASSQPALGNGGRFVLDLDEEVPEVRADPEKLRQVVDQLLENAVKYSPAGSVVRVEARARPEAVEVTVEDEGSGIDASQAERIFDKFYRGDETQPGTGLGLFIAQGLVSAMGGRIWVRSEEGGGSRFTFSLPVANEAEAA